MNKRIHSPSEPKYQLLLYFQYLFLPSWVYTIYCLIISTLISIFKKKGGTRVEVKTMGELPFPWLPSPPPHVA